MKAIKFIILVTLGLMCLYILSATQVCAFVYNGQAWCCESEIVFCVNPREPDTICTAAGRSFVDVVNAAAATWNAQGTAFQLLNGGATNRYGCIPDTGDPALLCVGNQDGQNVVSVADCPLPSGILATAWWWYKTPTGADDDCCIFEADICISNDVPWFTDLDVASCVSCYDMESVMLHEFGHWISLDHEDDDVVLGYRPSMFSTFALCEIRRAVTADDAAGLKYAYDATGVIVSSMRCEGTHSHPTYATSAKTPMFDACSFVSCDTTGCNSGVPSCDSVEYDRCINVCPQSDITYKVVLKDSCGVPICDTSGTWLDFTDCVATPCPGEEPNWPRVYADSCDPATGTHYFTVDAYTSDCLTCNVILYVNFAQCRMIDAFFLDVTNDRCVDPNDLSCMKDFDCNGTTGDAGDTAFFLSHLDHCCVDTCPSTGPNCTTISPDPCLLICPQSDVVYKVNVRDDCGRPVCDTSIIWLDFSNCPAIPCPGEEPFWPKVFPDSCDPATGDHYFTVDAGIDGCTRCDAELWLNGELCTTVPTRYLDNDGDLCVGTGDYVGGRVCDDFNCNSASDSNDSTIWAAHRDHCCQSPPCEPGPPYCDSVFAPQCLLVCPQSDAHYSIVVMDSCGNPVCDTSGTWLDFSQCTDVIPCPGEEPAWPRVFPDSCDPVTGRHFFTVDAGNKICTDCVVTLFVNGAPCRTVIAKFLDVDGDLCVTSADLIAGALCNDYDCDGAITGSDTAMWLLHLDHCCSCPDSDNDGICDDADNCPNDFNPNQIDSDGDGVGDSCDVCPGFDDKADADGDTVPDGCDRCPGHDDLQDGDSDGIADSCDNCPAHFNPAQEDTDGDGIGDSCCCIGIRGDINGDGSANPNILDLNYLVNYLFRFGPVPGCPKEADVNSDGSPKPNILDLNYLVNFLFRFGPPPGPC